MQTNTGGADENGEQHEMQLVVGSAVRRGSADMPAPTLLGAPKTAAVEVERVQVSMQALQKPPTADDD